MTGSRLLPHLSGSVLSLLLLFGVAACDPYAQFNKTPDDGLGPVDPVLFPPANVGVGGDRKRPGRGRFSEITAFVNDAEVGYFAYALPTLAAGADPLRVLQDGKPYAAVPTPTAYVFDGSGESAFPPGEMYPCTAPGGYRYDMKRDEVDYSKQGNVFAELPEATYAEGALPVTSYVPVVAESKVSSSGRPCQEIKSEKRIEAHGLTPQPSSKYLAWLIIDPSAPVYPRDNPTGVLPMSRMLPGVGLQRWGWFDRFLLAYLDGGYIPTAPATVMGGTMAAPTMIPVTRMVPQRLFLPRNIQMGMMMPAGQRGAGYDVLEFKRGEAGYSPLCQIWLYGNMAMPMPTTALPRNAQTILNTPELMAAAAAPASYVYCLQVR